MDTFRPGGIMKFKAIANKITGVSCPIFGLQWEPARLDVDVARRVIVFLEDRRVLYEPAELEIVDHCVASVLDIRRFLTEILGGGGIGSELEHRLRTLRTACREFLRSAGATRQNGQELWLPSSRDSNYGLDDWQLNQAIGEFRGRASSPIAEIAVMFGIDIEGSLERALPPVQD